MSTGRELTTWEIVDLNGRDRSELLVELREFRSRIGGPEVSDQTMVECSALLARALPHELADRIRSLQVGPAARGALLVRNLVDPELVDERTPDTLIAKGRPESTRLLELLLLGMMTFFGRPFTFASLYGGRIVQDIVPVPAQEQEQTSGGSNSFLEWHVEDAFSPERCDHLGLLCLRSDPTARTQFALVGDLDCTPACRRVLSEARFVVQPDSAHGEEAATEFWRTPILIGGLEHPEIRYDSIYMRPADPQDEEAGRALRELHTAIGRARVDHVLQQGDLLVLDNRRAVHARTAFRPRYDGQDRWLLRAMTRRAPVD